MKKYLLLTSICLLFASVTLTAQTDVVLQTAEGSLMGHNYTSAETNFTKYIDSYSSQLPAYFTKKTTYDTCNGYMRSTLLKDFHIRHDWAVPFYERGMARVGLGNKDSAQSDFETAIKIDPGYASAYYQVAIMKKDKGADKTVVCTLLGKARYYSDTLKTAKNAYVDNFCWMCGYDYFRKGKDEVDLKEFKEALANLNMAILISPDSANYYAYRGAAYNGLDNADSASADYSRALKRDSNNYIVFYQRAISFEKKQKYQEAFNDLTNVIRINPKYVDAYIHRAEDSEEMGKDASAQYDYQQIIRMKPNYGDAYYKIALYQMKMGQSGCAYFRKALDLGVDDAQGYVDDCDKEAKKATLVK